MKQGLGQELLSDSNTDVALAVIATIGLKLEVSGPQISDAVSAYDGEGKPTNEEVAQLLLAGGLTVVDMVATVIKKEDLKKENPYEEAAPRVLEILLKYSPSEVAQNPVVQKAIILAVAKSRKNKSLLKLSTLWDFMCKLEEDLAEKAELRKAFINIDTQNTLQEGPIWRAALSINGLIRRENYKLPTQGGRFKSMMGQLSNAQKHGLRELESLWEMMSIVDSELAKNQPLRAAFLAIDLDLITRK